MIYKKLVYIILILRTSIVYGQFDGEDKELYMSVVSNITSKAIVEYLNFSQFSKNESVQSYHLEDFFLPWDYFYAVCFTNINQNIGTYELFSFRGMRSFAKEEENVDPILVEHGMHYGIYSNTFNMYVWRQPFTTGIIGVDSVTHDVLFISGYMFLDDIKVKYFESGINDISRQEYIKLKYHNYIPEIKKVTRRYIDFYSRYTRRTYRVILKKNVRGKVVERISKISEQLPYWEHH